MEEIVAVIGPDMERAKPKWLIENVHAARHVGDAGLVDARYPNNFHVWRLAATWYSNGATSVRLGCMSI